MFWLKTSRPEAAQKVPAASRMDTGQGKLAIADSRQGTVTLYTVSFAGELERERQLPHSLQRGCKSLAFQPSSAFSLAACGKRGCVLWHRDSAFANECAQGRLEGQSEWSCHTFSKRSISCCDWSRSGSMLALALSDSLLGGVLVLDGCNPARWCSLRVSISKVTSLLWSEGTLFAREGRYLLREWVKPSYTPNSPPVQLHNGLESIAQLDWPNDALVATGGYVYKSEGDTGYYTPLSLPDGRHVSMIATSRSRIRSRTRLALAHDCGITILWLLQDEKGGLHTAALTNGEIEDRSVAAGKLESIAISPDERFLALQWTERSAHPEVRVLP